MGDTAGKSLKQQAELEPSKRGSQAEVRAEPERHMGVRVAANGWTVAPLFVESSGRPYSLDIFGGTRLAGGHESINGAGGAVYLPTVGRNTLRLPDTGRFDLRVSRAVHVTERVRMRGSVEIFNLTNRANIMTQNTSAYNFNATTRVFTPNTAFLSVTNTFDPSGLAVTEWGMS